MVAHVLRLRFDLLRGALRGDTRHAVRTLAGLFVTAVAVAAVCWAILQLRDAPVDTAFAVTVIAGSGISLGFGFAALLGGSDDQLDPRRFAVFGVAPRPLAGVLLLASLISVPAAALVAIGACLVLLWTAHGVAVPVAVAGVVLGILIALLVVRVCLALASLVLRERRSRELTGLFLTAVLVVVVPVGVFLASLDWDGRVPPALAEVVDVLALTPLGAAWALPARALDGAVAGPATVALVTVAALAAIWFWLVTRLLTTIERPVAAAERHRLGWFAVTPATPGGGIAARSLLYWLHDPRYLVNLVVVPVAAVFAGAPLLVVGVPMEVVALVPVPLMALFLGWLAHNDLAYDSTAIWMHLAAGVRGAADRSGRLVPITVIGVALLAVSIPVSIALHGRWATLPALVGVAASLFLCGLGVSSISSALTPYAVSRPGDSPFEQPQRTGGGLSQGVVLAVVLILSAPTLWFGWLAATSDEQHAWTSLWVGLGTGAVVLVAGIAVGGAVYNRRGSALLEFAEAT